MLLPYRPYADAKSEVNAQESSSIVNLTGPDTSHIIQGNLFHMNTFIEFLKKQIKLKLVTCPVHSNLCCSDY